MRPSRTRLKARHVMSGSSPGAPARPRGNPGYRVFFLLEFNRRLGRLQIPIVAARIGQAEETVRQWLYRESVPDEHWEALASVFDCKDDRQLLDIATRIFHEQAGEFPRDVRRCRVG